MKVLIDGLSYYINQGELGQYTTNLIDSLKPLEGDTFELIKDRDLEGINRDILPLQEQVLTINRRALDYRNLERCIASRNIDVYHCTNNGFTLMKNNHYPCKVLTTVHTVIPQEYERLYDPKYIRRNYYAMNILEGVTDKILCPSTFVKKFLADSLAIEERKLLVMVPRLHKVLPKTKDLVSEVYRKSKFNFKGDYLLYEGDLHPRKRLSEFFKVFEGLARRKRQVNLIILCPITSQNYNEYRRLREETEALGLRGRVFFLSAYNKGDRIHLYNGAKAIFDFSMYEGFNLSLLQGKAMGLNILCSDIETYREALGDYAFYVDINLPFADRILEDYLEEQDYYMEYEEEQHTYKDLYQIYKEM